MAKNDFAVAFNEVIEEKQLSKDIVVTAIESAMVSAYRRAVGASTAQHVEAKLDPDTGAVTVFAEKEVVEDNVIDERTEVLLEEARKVKEDVQAGDMLVVESTPADFGRVAAQTARQVIQQRIREAERSNQMEYYQRQEGEIVSGLVQAINAQGVTIGLDMKAEGVMPNNQKIPGERLKLHERVRAVVMEVKDGTRGPQIILSRAHRNFLRRLMENEVPEIYHGIVEIRAISREPGARAKVAVSATQPGIDPVGACVGMKGVRIQAIVKELHDEKIDVIQWDADPVVYISKAISPARVSGVYLAEGDDAHTATVVVGEDQLSLAIGRDGQNARLAAKLTGWRIDIKSLSEAAGDSLNKLKADTELQAMLPQAVEMIPQVEEVLLKKAESRAITPEEFTALAQFVDRVERKLVPVVEEAVVISSEEVESVKAEIPVAAYEMPITESGIKEHIINILTEAGYENVGQVMLDLKVNPNKILGLAGIGAKAIQNIEETLAALSFPEPVKVEEPVIVAPTPQVEQVPLPEKQVERKKEAKKVVEKDEEDNEFAKDGVSLDELFQMKPEMFQTTNADEESSDKKKDKKGKKKSVALEYDEERGEVVSRKKHKRGDDDGEDW
ncbi:MAG: transcription elongation protein NusA [Chloroflexi bacterium OLB14]|nr:MAG: transcription elongation protein NusA [Chloroflexi bacterium OLB14]